MNNGILQLFVFNEKKEYVMATKRKVGFPLCGTVLLALALFASGCVLWETGAEAPGVAYVDTFDLSGATCGLGKRMQAKKSVGGRTLTVGGKTYGRGFGTRAESGILFRANGKKEESVFSIPSDPAHVGMFYIQDRLFY